MKYCSKCGKETKEGSKFCQYCGEKVENYKEDNKQLKQKATSIVNLHNLAGNKKDIIRYLIGLLFVLFGIINLPKINGLVGIAFGVSLMPIVYKILKDNKNIEFKGMQIIIPIVLIFLLGLTSTSSTDNDLKDNIKDNKSNFDIKEESYEEKWNNYYNEKGIEIINVDNETLFDYGIYYKNKTVLTGIEVYNKSTKTIKANGKNDSINYSFVLNFDDKSEIEKYKKGDKLVIIGEVSNSTTNKTVTINKCHIVLTGNLATAKIEELSNNKQQYIDYIKLVKEDSDRKGDIGKAYIEISDANVINIRGENILVVSLLYQNNDNKNNEFNYIANVNVFQNGVELKSSIMKCSWYDDNYKDNGDVEIQPGVSVTVNKCFLIDDVSSDVEVNVEAWMFASMYNKLNKTFKLT